MRSGVGRRCDTWLPVDSSTCRMEISGHHSHPAFFLLNKYHGPRCFLLLCGDTARDFDEHAYEIANDYPALLSRLVQHQYLPPYQLMVILYLISS